MAGPTVECYNCGNANPSWAQVCRSCGVPIRPSGSGPEGPFPTDQDSLVSMGAGVGAIVLAVLLGLFLSGLIPPAPTVSADPTPTARPSRTPRPSQVPEPSTPASADPSAAPTAELLGTVTFGTGLDSTTRAVTGATDTFGPGSTFAHSVALPEPFGVNQIQEEIIRVESDNSLTVVQERSVGGLGVSPNAMVAGFTADADLLINGWGPGTYILRDYRGEELVAEGRFILTN
jgi:hypothetical protein